MYRLIALSLAGAVAGQQIRADAWSSDVEVDQKRPPSMITKRAALMSECRQEAEYNEQLCTGKGLEEGLQNVCLKEVPIKQMDCRNKKMCELKLGFLQNKCIEAFNVQAYGRQTMTDEKVMDVGKCFTRILRDHMKCKDNVSQTTHNAMEQMRELLEKQTADELRHKEEEEIHMQQLKRKALHEAAVKTREFTEELTKAENVEVDTKVIEVAEEAIKEVIELQQTVTSPHAHHPTKPIKQASMSDELDALEDVDDDSIMDDDDYTYSDSESDA